MNLIIKACLSEPPSESLYFRYLTLVAKEKLKYEVLVESEKDLKDLYYKYLKRKGAMDYVSQIIVPEEKEIGIRIDTENSSRKTIVVKCIVCENVLSLIEKIENYK